jgi:hypothetical protein
MSQAVSEIGCNGLESVLRTVATPSKAVPGNALLQSGAVLGSVILFSILDGSEQAVVMVTLARI